MITAFATCALKLAVSVLLPDIVIVTDELVDVDAPDHPVNEYPEYGVAVTVTVVPGV